MPIPNRIIDHKLKELQQLQYPIELPAHFELLRCNGYMVNKINVNIPSLTETLHIK